MKFSAKQLARISILAALGTVLLVLASLLPTARIAVLAAASFPVCAALMMCGPVWSAVVFAGTAALGMLLLPGTAAAGYAVFFGWYPIVKSLCEKIRDIRLCISAKGLVFTAAFALYRLAAVSLFAAEAAVPWYWLYLIGLAVFYVYDWAYSILIRFYLDKLARFFS